MQESDEDSTLSSDVDSSDNVSIISYSVSDSETDLESTHSSEYAEIDHRENCLFQNYKSKNDSDSNNTDYSLANGWGS